MAEGFFTITELFPDGSEVTQFTWTADRQAPTGEGGARACPVKPWRLAGKQRKNRTDYAGSRRPTIQVLGPSHEPFTLSGTWDSRYNFEGYAKREMKRFEQMARRGNLCRFQYDDLVRVGILDTWNFSHEITWLIRYEFTVDTTHVPGEDAESPADTPHPPITRAIDDSEAFYVAQQEADRLFRPHSILGDLGDTVTSNLASIGARLDEVSATLSQNEVSTLTDQIVTPFKRLATQMRTLRGSAIDFVDDLADTRQDSSLATSDAIATLNFEVWIRTMREFSRRIAGANYTAASQVEERDTPAAQTIYRPQRGESLYRIARQFYGTPTAWRLIADRNNIHTITLTGEEVLIIPERRQA